MFDRWSEGGLLILALYLRALNIEQVRGRRRRVEYIYGAVSKSCVAAEIESSINAG